MSIEGTTIASLLKDEYPNEWREVPLSSIADIRFSGVNKVSQPGEEPVRLCNYTDVYNNDYIDSDMDFMYATATRSEIDRFGLQVGDVIITKDSETPDDIGIPAVVDNTAQDLVCGYHLALIRPDQNLVDPTFLSKQLSHDRIARYFGQQANGTTRYGLSTFSIANVPLYLPMLEDQRSASALIRLVDNTIAKTQAVIAKLKQVRAGLLHDLLSYGLDEHGQLRDPVARPEQFKDSPLGRIPRGWDVEIIGQLPISIIDGDRGSNYPSEAHLFNQGYCVFLNNKNIKDGKFDFSFAQFITKERDALLRKGKLQLGDIVITTRGTVGNIALLKNINPYEHIRINSGMIILRSYEDRFKAEFFVEVWQHLFPSEYRRLSSGSAQPQFPIRDMQGFRLIIPPKPEQERIARFLSRSHLAIDQHKTELDKLTKVKSGLMNDVLNGRVRVPETIAEGG